MTAFEKTSISETFDLREKTRVKKIHPLKLTYEKPEETLPLWLENKKSRQDLLIW